MIKIVSGSESAGDRLYPSAACLFAAPCHPNLEQLKYRRCSSVLTRSGGEKKKSFQSPEFHMEEKHFHK